MKQLLTILSICIATALSGQVQYFANDGDFDFVVTDSTITVVITKQPTPLEKCPGLTVVYVYDIYQNSGAESWHTNVTINSTSATIPRQGVKVSASVKYFAYGCNWGSPCGFTPWYGIGAKKWN